jgi:uncharacterized membrane protein YeaQ/YmgE (transglycosylase-associated protein family)
MSFIVFLILTFFWGLLVGAFARLALPGPDPMSLFQTALLGIAGSLLAGIVVWVLSGGRWGAGFLASLVFSVLILYFVRRSRGGGLTDPGRVGRR